MLKILKSFENCDFIDVGSTSGVIDTIKRSIDHIKEDFINILPITTVPDTLFRENKSIYFGDKKISKELKLIETTLKLSRTLKSNKELTYRVLAQIASSVPNRVKFDKVEYNGKYNLTIQGIAATDQDILRFIDNLSKQKLIEQASLSSMKLPRTKVGEVTMKGFRVFVKIKRV